MNTGGERPDAAPSPAVAPPPGNPRFALFDSLRAIAALSVLTFHVSAITGALEHGLSGDVLAMLSRGVIVFFVISGFLLYRPYVASRASGRPRPRTARFERRRVLRIVPAYWVALTVLAIYPGIHGVFSADWWRYYFFLQVYWQDSFSGGIPVAWSLCVEAAFYVALPFWALGMSRARLGSGPRAWLRAELAGLALLAAAGIAIQVASAQQAISMPVAEGPLGQSTWLALGMALAVASVAAETSPGGSRVKATVAGNPGLCWFGAGASLVGLALVLHPGGILGITAALSTAQSIPRTLAAIALTAGLSTLLVLPAIFGEREGGVPRRILAAPPLAWLGLISYAIYLYHLTIAELLGLPADPLHFSASGLDVTDSMPILLILTFAVTTAVAAISYYVVELPFLRRKEGWLPVGRRAPGGDARPAR